MQNLTCKASISLFSSLAWACHKKSRRAVHSVCRACKSTAKANANVHAHATYADPTGPGLKIQKIITITLMCQTITLITSSQTWNFRYSKYQSSETQSGALSRIIWSPQIYKRLYPKLVLPGIRELLIQNSHCKSLGHRGPKCILDI